MSQTSHPFAFGRVCVLENALVNSDKLKRVLDAKSAEDALKGLVEIGFGAGEQANDVYDYEKLIKRDLETAYAFVHDVTPDEKITNLFFYHYDYHNVKVLIKAGILKEEPDDLLIPYGTIDVEVLKQAVDNPNRVAIPQEMAEFIKTCTGEAEIEATEIGYLADGALYKQIARELKSIKGKGAKSIEQYFNVQADYNNVLAVLRSRGLKDASLISKAYLPLGNFTLNELYDTYEKDNESFLKLLRMKKVDSGLIEGVSYYFENGTMSLMEKNRDNYFIKLFKPLSKDAFSIGPVLGYLMAKEQQANIIRLIMVAKINELPQEQVLERLRDLYE